MKINKLFALFRAKLLGEGMLASLVAALSAAGFTAFVISLVYHILIMKTPVAFTALISGAVAVVVFLALFFIRYLPTDRRVAKRVDGMGLKERTLTMLENRENPESMAIMQRDDAVTKVKGLSVKKMKFVFPVKASVFLAASVILCTVIFLLPYDILSFADPKDELELKQEQIIKDLIEDLREEIKNSVLDKPLKDEINDVVDDLEEELDKSDDPLDQAGKIEDAKDKISEIIEKELSKNKIGLALQKYEMTKELGVGVCGADTQKVSSSLDLLESKLKNDRKLTPALGEIIKKALEDSGVKSDDKLYMAFDSFAEALLSLDIQSESFESDLSLIFDIAEKDINALLEKQKAIESEKEKLEDIMDQAKDELLENKDQQTEAEKTGQGDKPGEGEQTGEGNGEKPGGDKPGDKPGDQPGGDKPGGDKPGGDKPGEDPGDKGEGGDKGSDGSGSGDDEQTEGIYDPILGQVGYGEVFATYYAEYLKALEKGNVPPYLEKIMEEYFNTLK